MILILPDCFAKESKEDNDLEGNLELMLSVFKAHEKMSESRESVAERRESGIMHPTLPPLSSTMGNSLSPLPPLLWPREPAEIPTFRGWDFPFPPFGFTALSGGTQNLLFL